jgi:EmrB/QacA subfamily drug resistance transporter
MSLRSLSNVRIAYKWQVTIVVTLGMLMSMMDATIVNVAVPQMQNAFRANIHDVQWVVTIYMLTQAVVIPTAPYLTAKFGGKRAYVWTLVAFLLGSLLCGFAWNLPSLVFFRCIQGIGGGILLPMVMILQYQAFPPEERGMAGSVMGVPMQLAPVVGPVLGGYLVTSFGWQWAFFINIPLGVVAISLAQRVLRQTSPEQRKRFDLAGFLAAAMGSAALLYAVSVITNGDTTVRNFLFLFAGVLILLAFVFIEMFKVQRGQEALLDLRRFRDRTFVCSVLSLVFFSVVMFGILFLIPIYLQNLHRETALQAGTIQMAEALALLAIIPLAGRLCDKIGPRPVVIVGLILLIGVTALMMTLALNTPLRAVVGILILLGFALGFALQIPISAMSRIGQGEQKEIANGSTLVAVLRAIAAPLGVATLSSIVQERSQQYATSLAAQGITGELLRLQSSLLAMRESFLVAAFLAMVALVAMCFAPGRRKSSREQPEQKVLVEMSIP